MTQVFLFTASDRTAQANLQKSIYNGVDASEGWRSLDAQPRAWRRKIFSVRSTDFAVKNVPENRVGRSSALIPLNFQLVEGTHFNVDRV